MKRLLRWYAVLLRALHRTLVSVLAHDCLNVAQSIAYSAIIALFPALIVAAAVIGLLPDSAPIRFQLAAFFDRVLPASVSTLLDATFENAPKHAHSLRALVGAGVVSFAGASNVISTLMEGLRRARHLPHNCWSFWQRRIRSFALVPLSVAQLAIACLLVVFGHAATQWLFRNIDPQLRFPIYAISLLIRWTVALGASVALIALIYHLGVPDELVRITDDEERSFSQTGIGPSKKNVEASSNSVGQVPHVARGWWWRIFPGAALATVLWFPSTILFGWYVTRFTNYTEVYGPLGAGIALLFWLYIISLSVLCGAEFNVHFNAQIDAHFGGKRRLGHR
jgi:membrane protein